MPNSNFKPFLVFIIMAPMSSSKFDQWREAGLRRKLSKSEVTELRAFLDLHPDATSEIEFDMALNQMLRQLPDRPISSNFTAQVLQAVTHARSQATILPAIGWTWRWLRHQLPRWAMAGLLIGIGLFSYRQYQLQSRFELARSVMTVSNISTLAPVEVWQNYDAIVRLSHVPLQVDEDLLKALEN